MNANVESTLVSLFNTAVQTGKDVYAFAQEQAPELVREVLVYHTAVDATWIILGLIVMIGANMGRAKLWQCYLREKEFGDTCSTQGDWQFSAIMASCIGGFIGGVMILPNLFHLIKVVFAPRMFLIEYVSALIK